MEGGGGGKGQPSEFGQVPGVVMVAGSSRLWWQTLDLCSKDRWQGRAF